MTLKEALIQLSKEVNAGKKKIEALRGK